MAPTTQTCTAFAGFALIASGALLDVALKVKQALDRGEQAPVLIFDDATSALIEIDVRGSADDVLQRLAAEPGAFETAVSAAADGQARRGPGRPKLGVVAREVTLLPRHWDWLNSQPGGASVALRKLVDEAKRANEGRDRIRQAQDAAYRFMSVMVGDQPGYEEATRALFATDRPRFDALSQLWAADVRDHARKLAAAAFASQPGGVVAA